MKVMGFILFTSFFLLSPQIVNAELREFTFTVTEGQIELNGTKFMVWKYNNQFPGPEIRVKEGDTVRVKLRNMSGAKHGLFFHGLHVNPRTSLQEQEIFVDPGYEYTYGEFIAKPAGTHLYHCSWNMAEHLSRGLYGAFIVEASDEPRYDKEFVFILSDWSSKIAKGEGHHEPGHPRAMMDNDITTINDRAVTGNNPVIIDVKKGEKIRIRLANIGFLPHTLRFQEGFVITHEDGYRMTEPKGQYSLTIYPGKRYDIVIVASRPGKFPFYHSINFPMPLVEYESHQEGPDKHDYDDRNKPMKEDVVLILDVKEEERQ